MGGFAVAAGEPGPTPPPGAHLRIVGTEVAADEPAGADIIELREARAEATRGGAVIYAW